MVIEAKGLYVLDTERGVTNHLRIPAGRVDDVATWNGRAVALCGKDGEYRLLVRNANGWDELEIPADARRVATKPKLIADQSTLVLFINNVAFKRTDKTWERINLKPRPKLMFSDDSNADHLLLVGNKLYLGFDWGEWGGQLLSLELKTGEWMIIDQYRLPIRDLKIGPGEKVWVVEGLAHLSLREGRIHQSDEKSWQTICDTANWALPPASLDAMAFDGDGRVVLLSGSLGLIRQDRNGWTRLTPGWPNYAYVHCLHISPTGLAVIGMYDAGILLIDLNSQKTRRIVLSE
jgi:hypothetical protein